MKIGLTDICCDKMVRLVRFGYVKPLIEGKDERDGVRVSRIYYTYWQFCPFCGTETDVIMMEHPVMR